MQLLNIVQTPLPPPLRYSAGLLHNHERHHRQNSPSHRRVVVLIWKRKKQVERFQRELLLFSYRSATTVGNCDKTAQLVLKGAEMLKRDCVRDFKRRS